MSTSCPTASARRSAEIYREKGFCGDDLERAVAVITASRERWIDTMMAEEYGQPKTLRAPWKAALSTFAAFLICGAVPLLPFAVNSSGKSGLSLAATGQARSRHRSRAGRPTVRRQPQV